jgi:hypothetical protein
MLYLLSQKDNSQCSYQEFATVLILVLQEKNATYFTDSTDAECLEISMQGQAADFV